MKSPRSKVRARSQESPRTWLQGFILTTLSIGTLFLFAGCSDDDSPGTPQVSDGQIRAIHLSPDAPAVDVYTTAEGGSTAQLYAGVAFPNGGPYQTVAPGTYTVSVAAAGSDPGDAVLSVPGLGVEAGRSYTAVAYDVLDEVKALWLADDNSEVAQGQVRVRAVHTAVGIGEVDIWNVPAEGAPTPLWTNVPFGGIGAYLTIPAGTYTLGFDVDNDANPDVFFNLPPLSSGTVANVFATTDDQGTPFLRAQTRTGESSIQVGTDPMPMARLRVSHLSPNAPSVDVFLNGNPDAAVTDLEFEESTGFLGVPAGTYRVDIAPTGAGINGSVLTVTGLDLEGGESYTAAAYNSLSSLSVLPLAEDFEGTNGNLRLRAIHTAVGIGTVDIWSLPADADPVRLYDNLTFGGVGDYLDIPAGTYTIGIDADQDATPDFVVALPPLGGDQVVNAFAVTDEEGNPFLYAQFDDGATARLDGDSSSLRVIHLVPGAPNVDALLNTTRRVARDIEFVEGSDFEMVAASGYRFDVTPHNRTAHDAVLTVDPLMLETGNAYTAVAYMSSQGILGAAMVEDLSPVTGGQIRVRAAHFANGVGTVDIWNIPATGAPTRLYDDVPFGAVGDYLTLPAGAYTLGFDVDNDAVPDQVFSLPALPAGTVANVFAVTDEMGMLFLAAHLQDGTVARIDVAMGNLRVLHLSPDAPGVDVFINANDRPSVRNLAYTKGTNPTSIPSGSLRLDVAPTGSDRAGSVLTVTGVPIVEGGNYTAVAFNNVASIQALALQDDLSPPAAGNIRVRAIHTAVGVGEVDIWNIPTTGDPTPLCTNVNFGDAGAYLELPVGTYTLGFDVDNDANPDLYFVVPELPSGAVANVFAVNDDSGVYLLAQLSGKTLVRIDTAPATLRVLHLSPDAPNVDVFLNRQPAPFPGNLPFTQGRFGAVTAGVATLDIAPTGTGVGNSVLTVPGLSLVAGRTYTAVAFDRVSSLQALALADDFDVPAGQIRVRAIHTASAIGEVDIWNVPMTGDPTPLYENVPFGAAGSYLDLPAGSYRLGFDVDNDSNPDVLFSLPSLAAGTVANVFAVTDADDNVFLLAQFQDGLVARINPDPPTMTGLRAIHLSSDAPPVDVYLNQMTMPAITNLAYYGGTGYADIDPETKRLDIAPANTSIGNSVLTVDGLSLKANALYTAVAFDAVANLTPLLLEDKPVVVGEDNVLVRVIHTATGVGNVDVMAIRDNGSMRGLVSDLAFGEDGGYATLAPNEMTVGLDANRDGAADFFFGIPSSVRGSQVNVFAVVDDSGVSLAAQLEDGTVVRLDPATTQLRALHLSPDSPSVDVYLNGSTTPAAQDLAFKTGTAFLTIPAGTYTVDIAPANTSIESSVLTVPGLFLGADRNFTAVAYNEVASLDALGLEEDLSTPSGIRVRAIHTAVGVGQVDIWNIPGEGDPTPLYTDVDFGVAGDYLELPAGAYTLGFDLDNDANPELYFELPALGAGTIANVFATSDDSGVFLLAQLQTGDVVRIDPATTQLRAMHVSPDAELVDVYLNGSDTPSVEDLDFEAGTAFLTIPAGAYTIDIAPANTSIESSVLTLPGLALTPGDAFTAAAFNELASLQALALGDDLSTPSGIRVRAIHTAVGVGQVDIWNVPTEGDPSPLFVDVDFGAAGDYLDLPSGAYTLGIDVDNDAVPDLLFQLPELGDGTIANVYAVADNGIVFLLAQLADGAVVRIDSSSS